jgi:hypothetical protein
MCYGSGCKWEIQYGEDAGECKKPSQLPCPQDEDYEEEEDVDYEDGRWGNDDTDDWSGGKSWKR